MMVVLEILKIIGIVLAVIIGLIIVIICLVLFAPFKYTVTAEGENEAIDPKLSVKFLGGLLHLIIEIENGGLEMKTHLAGIELKKKENSLLTRIAKRIGLAIWELIKEYFFGIVPEKKKKAEQKSEPEEKKVDDDSPKFVKKIRSFVEKVKNIWEKLKLAKYVLGAPVTARAWKYLKQQLAGLFNHVKPASMEGEVTFGTGDPASTAETFGIAGWIAALMDERLLIIPDMYNKTVKMDVVIKGRIIVRYVLSFLWRILTHKDIRRVVGYIGRNL